MACVQPLKMMTKCNICQKELEMKHIISHMKYVHKSFGRISVQCTFGSCCRSFSQINSLRRHLKSHSPSDTVNPQIPKLDFFVDHGPNSTDTSFDIESSTNAIESPDYQILKNDALKLISSLYADASLSRIQIQRIVDSFNILLHSDYVEKLKRYAVSSVNEGQKGPVSTKFEALQNTFSDLLSEHSRLRVLEEHKYFLRPESILLGYMEVRGKYGSLENKEVYGQYVPLTAVLTAFFQVPDVLKKTLNYFNSLKHDSSEIENIIQTDYWKSKVAMFDSIVFPLFLYQDDFEIGNPLGSRAGIHKLCGTYASIACLPPEYRSKLQNIFLVLLCHSQDVKIFDKKVLYKSLINDLNDLQTNGIQLLLDGKSVKIYFKLAMIIGDNLGLNGTLGFVECFRANFSCRFCKTPLQVSKSLCSEDVSTLRTKEMYDLDLLKNTTETGIKAPCVWNAINDFHAIDNPCVDVMHDILEGIARYELVSLLKYLILEKKYFTLDTLNCRMKYFDYKVSCNRPPLINIDDLKSSKLKMSASEMQTFIHNAGLLFGDLIPDKNDKYWELFKLLRQILQICLQTSVSKGTSTLLQCLIKEHHELLIELHGNSLVSKHHNLIHYPGIMDKVGPLRHIWAMRFEAKHRVSKKSAVVSFNRINICYTLAIKHQLQFSDTIIRNQPFVGNIFYRKCKESRNISPDYPGDAAQLVSIKWVQSNNVKYAIGTIILKSIDDLPVFGKIQGIYLKQKVETPQKSDFLFHVQVIKCQNYDDHLQAYVVYETNVLQYVHLESVINEDLFNVITKSGGTSYVQF